MPSGPAWPALRGCRPCLDPSDLLCCLSPSPWQRGHKTRKGAGRVPEPRAREGLLAAAGVCPGLGAGEREQRPKGPRREPSLAFRCRGAGTWRLSGCTPPARAPAAARSAPDAPPTDAAPAASDQAPGHTGRHWPRGQVGARFRGEASRAGRGQDRKQTPAPHVGRVQPLPANWGVNKRKAGGTLSLNTHPGAERTPSPLKCPCLGRAPRHVASALAPPGPRAVLSRPGVPHGQAQD